MVDGLSVLSVSKLLYSVSRFVHSFLFFAASSRVVLFSLISLLCVFPFSSPFINWFKSVSDLFVVLLWAFVDLIQPRIPICISSCPSFFIVCSNQFSWRTDGHVTAWRKSDSVDGLRQWRLHRKPRFFHNLKRRNWSRHEHGTPHPGRWFLSCGAAFCAFWASCTTSSITGASGFFSGRLYIRAGQDFRQPRR